MSLHSAQTANHRLESWVYADAAARAAATGFVAGDVGKIAYQTDTGVYYRLTDESPITWVEATSAAASETLAGKVELATTTEAETGTDTARAVTPAGLPMRKIGTGWALGIGGNARGAGAVDLQTVRAAAGQVASGDNAVIGGGYNNTASGYYSTISGGRDNAVSDSGATIGGGFSNTVDSSGATISGGDTNTASGYYSTVSGGRVNAATADYSTICGGRNAKADKYGQRAHASGMFAAQGDIQTSVLVARRSTTTATPAELFLDGSAARCTIAADTTWAFRIMVVARRTDADNESAAYEFVGCIDNNAGVTALVGSVTTTVVAEDNVGWDCAVTADDTNDALIITVTGEAGKTIRWVARIELTEVTG